MMIWYAYEKGKKLLFLVAIPGLFIVQFQLKRNYIVGIVKFILYK